MHIHSDGVKKIYVIHIFFIIIKLDIIFDLLRDILLENVYENILPLLLFTNNILIIIL